MAYDYGAKEPEKFKIKEVATETGDGRIKDGNEEIDTINCQTTIIKITDNTGVTLRINPPREACEAKHLGQKAFFRHQQILVQ